MIRLSSTGQSRQLGPGFCDLRRGYDFMAWIAFFGDQRQFGVRLSVASERDGCTPTRHVVTLRGPSRAWIRSNPDVSRPG